MEMLTAKEIEEMLQVDRSTVYRMAEAGRLPAIKVGKQWRFPADEMSNWFEMRMAPPLPPARSAIRATPVADSQSPPLAGLLPLACVQLIQNSFADLLGVMMVITDMEGAPITEVSNPCGLFASVSEQPDAVRKCVDSWHDLATDIDLTAQFKLSHLGLLCARSMIRVGAELKGMLIVGGIAPDAWPPSAAELEKIAARFDVPPTLLMERRDDVYWLDDGRKEQVLNFLPRIANIIAHIVDERKALVNRLEAIASLTQL